MASASLPLSVPFLFILLASSATACDRCTHQSKVGYFSNPNALSNGACGYGSMAVRFNSGFLAAASPSLYKNGAACGACFQIRCKKPGLCSSKGTTVIVTDQVTTNKTTTDFVLSNRAFMALANPGKAQSILELGTADVEYKRVPCDLKTKNLAVRVEESSKKPNHLAIKVLYQGGQTEIVGIDVARIGSSNWAFLSRNHGAVWEMDRVPEGPLHFRFMVTGGFDGKWVWTEKAVLPGDWKVGVVYDTGLQISDIAQEPCSPCDDSTWK
ncbi:Expansin-like A1 [Linum grandiflorum]